MARRVRPGDSLNITAVEYNRLLAAAEASHRNRLPGGGGPRTHLRNASTVRIHNTSGAVVPIGGIAGFDSPITDPEAGPVELTRFVRDATIKTVRPTEDEHTGRVGVAIEPIRDGEVGRVVFYGVVAAQVDITKTWHRFADVGESGGDTLQSKPDGSAQILWRQEPSKTGRQWAVVRVGRPADPVYLVKVPSGGIAARRGMRTGSADCDLFELDEDGEIKPVDDPAGDVVRITARNHSAQRIRGPIEGSGEDQYLVVTFDGHRSWVIDPPNETLLCKPTKRLKAKSWGTARELRFDGARWRPLGVRVSVYNVCDYALLASQQIICHFHEDTGSYVTIGCRCCDGSSSSSSSSSSGSSPSSVSSSSSSPSSSSSSPSSSSSSSPSSSSSSSSPSSSSSSISSISSSSSSLSSSSSSSSPSSSSSSQSSSSSSRSSTSPSSSSHPSSSSIPSSSSSSTSPSSSSSSQSSSPSSSSVSDSSSSKSSSVSDSSSSNSSSVSDSSSSTPSESTSTSESISESASESDSETSVDDSSDSRSNQSGSPPWESGSESGSGSQASGLTSASVSDGSQSGSDDSGSDRSASDGSGSNASGSEASNDSGSDTSEESDENSGGGGSDSSGDSVSDESEDSASEGSNASDDDSEDDSGDTSDGESGGGGSGSGSNNESTDESVDDSGGEDSGGDSGGDDSGGEDSEGEDSGGDESDGEESSDGSNDACESTWIWSCGWELQGSDCEDAGDPPSSSGSYDGEVVTVSA